MYKLLNNEGLILRLSDGAMFSSSPQNRDYQSYLIWLAAGNMPEPADEPTPEEIARQEEIIQAPLTARQFFAATPAAIDFIRLTPEDQMTQIDAMTTAQLKTLTKYLTVAVSAMIKREFL